MWWASEGAEGAFASSSFQLLLASTGSGADSHVHMEAPACSSGRSSWPYWPNIATKPYILQKPPWLRGIGRKGQRILPFFSLTKVLGMAVICQKVWLFLMCLHTVMYVTPFQVEFYSDNNNNLFLSLCWRKQTSFQVSVPLDCSREQRFVLCILFMTTPTNIRRIP